MCFSAQIVAGYRKFIRVHRADLSLDDFVQLFVDRSLGAKVKIPKALEDELVASPSTPQERQLQELSSAFRAEQATSLEQNIFKQRTRLAEAERALATKITKKASESKRIATDKVAQDLRRLEDLKRTSHAPRDSRIFSGSYAPVIISENGRLVVKPMRYLCRLPGRPAATDQKYPGAYNARRDNLEGYWKPLFGQRHGILVADKFFENVKRHRLEGRELRESEDEENVVLEFTPSPGMPMLVACLWSHWSNGKEPDLLSFAAITDEPPEEVAAAGHDRCIIPLKEQNLGAWLNPQGSRLEEMYRILDDKERPYYEHRLAA